MIKINLQQAKTCTKCCTVLSIANKTGLCKPHRIQRNNKKFRQNNQELANKLSLNWYFKNKDRVNKRAAERMRDKHKTDPLFRLKRNLRSRTRLAIQRRSCSGSAIKDLGCSIDQLYSRLCKSFQPGMSWSNYGTKWHIDHIIPLASAKTSEELIKLCHYTNLQPLWAKDNLSKGAKV